MKTRSITRRPPNDAYFALVRRFPLRPIRGDAEHAQATQIIGELIGRDLDAGSGDYLDTLVLLVGKYEDEHHTVPGDLDPREALRAIMDANGLTQQQVGRIIGSESAVSMFLNGRRSLSKAHVKALAGRFRLDPMLFL